MKLTEENYKECLDTYKKLKNGDGRKETENRMVKFTYYNIDISYSSLESYAFNIGIVLKIKNLSGSIMEISFLQDV